MIDSGGELLPEYAAELARQRDTDMVFREQEAGLARALIVLCEQQVKELDRRAAWMRSWLTRATDAADAAQKDQK